MSGKDEKTIAETIEFLRVLAGDTCSVLKADCATIMATIEGAPERFSDLAERIYNGRGHLRDLDKIFVAAESRIISTFEHGGQVNA
jgi:hypothetical protein